MKHLVLVRHAKSSWTEPGLADFDRPLNERGRRDAPLMAARLSARFDGIVTSPALRALATAEAFAAALGIEPARIERADALYLAGVETLVRQVRGFDPRWQRVLLVGHQPGLGDLVGFLAGGALEHLPTCGVAELELAVERWAELRRGCGELARFDFPKRGEGGE